MKVLTVSKHKLKELTNTLFFKITEEQYDYDIIIGIKTGGIYISRPIKEQLINADWKGTYYEIELTRPSTKTKKKLHINFLLIRLPYLILDTLRNLELYFLESFKSTNYDPGKEKTIVFSEKLLADIKNADSLLLIDDAIDSGSTLLAIKNVIKHINKNIDIKSAVLTVTHKKPYLEPNYLLYRRVLLRCPWSQDYKGNDKIG